MRESLKIAVKNAICVECYLPHKGIERSCLSSQNDFCFRNDSSECIANVIYNGIIEFAKNEYEINYDNLDLEQRREIIKSLRYSENATEETKLKYGFYGEVLLDLILRCFLKTSVLISKGYFYSPLEDSEAKGFDAFHLFERNGNPELWFGEAKFHQNFRQAITQVLEKIHISLSDGYLNKNLIAIIDQKEKCTTSNCEIENMIIDWEQNPDINLVDEINHKHIRLVYPIFIAFEKYKTGDYYRNIQECISHVSDEFYRLGISIPATFDYRIFFMFLPLSEVKKIKEDVISWIELRKPLI